MSQTTAPAPADPAAPDEALAAQPIGYWSGVVHKAVIGRIRDEMARIDVTQPQWWTLNQVAAGGDAGPSREDVAARLADFADSPDEPGRAVDQLLHRGWLGTGEDGRLRVTESGLEAMARIKELVTALRAEIHEGITDEEWVAALKVLRRMKENLAR
ncbi:MarR family winged helix-turn-helix transcriptional regulator [Streptomyces sp.]|uniref:MarR family winged helix-turn-helix transcriptional regulator n=1 Tax=Streptomyces sp. TaxID=1931 RepID=UPI002F95D959